MNYHKISGKKVNVGITCITCIVIRAKLIFIQEKRRNKIQVYLLCIVLCVLCFFVVKNKLCKKVIIQTKIFYVDLKLSCDEMTLLLSKCVVGRN